MRQGLHPADHTPYTNLGLDGVPVPWEDMIRQSQAIVGDEVDLLAEADPPAKQPKPISAEAFYRGDGRLCLHRRRLEHLVMALVATTRRRRRR